jgi:thiol-disulfide isomerase/thioredoxin
MILLACGFLPVRAQLLAAQNTVAENLAGAATDPFVSAGKHALVLVFVRTDCPISNRYAPTIQKLSREFAGKANFWLVYPDAAEPVARIRAHVKEYRYNIPALRDVHKALVKRAEATVTPEVAVFDGQGRLAYHGRIDNWYEDFGRSRAAPTTHELADAIRATLAGQAPPTEHASAVGCYISDVK